MKQLPCIYASNSFSMGHKDAILKALIAERDNLTVYNQKAIDAINDWLGFGAPDFYRSVG